MKKTITPLIAFFMILPQISNAQNVVKNISGPSDNPSYAAIKPYWIDKPVIEVIGRSNVMFNPNRVSMNFTIQEINENADEGLAKLTKRTKPVIEKVKSMLGKDDSITVNYRREAIYQQYKDKDGNKISNQREDKIENYVLRWDIAITTQKFEIVPKIKAEILAIGNSRMNNGEYYSFVPSTEQTRQVFQAAVEDGASRAEMVASVNKGSKLKLLVVQEGQNQCLSSPTTQTGSVVAQDEYEMRASPAMALAEAAPPPEQNGGARLQASDLIMPSAPSKYPLAASVCMVYAIE